MIHGKNLPAWHQEKDLFGNLGLRQDKKPWKIMGTWKGKEEAGEMSQWLKALADFPEVLSSVPSTHMVVEKGNYFQRFQNDIYCVCHCDGFMLGSFAKE